MEFEKLKQKLILEAHNHFAAVQKARPYVKFGNFVESLCRDDNKPLIESIQKGVLSIIEGAFQNENDPGRALLKKAEAVTPEQLNEFIKNNDISQLTGLLYPFIIQTIDKASFPNENTADKVFGNTLNNLQSAISNMEPMTGGTPAAYLANYSNNFLTGPLVKDARQPTKQGQIRKDEDVPPDIGNTAQGWEFRDASKREGARKYGKAVDHKNIEKDGELTPMIHIRWKGIKNKSNNWVTEPFKEWIPGDELQAYNITDQDNRTLSTDVSFSNNTTLEDTISSSTDFSDEDMSTNVLKLINSMVDKMDVGDNIKKAISTYFKQSTTDKTQLAGYKSIKQNMEKALKSGNLPNLKESGKINPAYDTMEKVQKELDNMNQMIEDSTPPKIRTLGREAGVSVKVLTTYINKLRDIALEKQEIWDARDKALEPETVG